MDFTNVNTSPSYVNAPVVTTVEKTDRQAPQVKPVGTSGASNKASLGNNELHRQENGTNKTEDAMSHKTEDAMSHKTEDAMSPEALAKVAEDIQGKLDQMGSTLGFSINKKYESIVAEISNRDSGEVIRQIPSEDILALREKLQEVVGLFFDEKV